MGQAWMAGVNCEALPAAPLAAPPSVSGLWLLALGCFCHRCAYVAGPDAAPHTQHMLLPLPLSPPSSPQSLHTLCNSSTATTCDAGAPKRGCVHIQLVCWEGQLFELYVIQPAELLLSLRAAVAQVGWLRHSGCRWEGEEE